jgi:UDP-glucose 4-epimerase
MEKAAGQPIPLELAPRRAGDAPVSFADPARAKAELGWTARLGIDEMCRDAVNFQRQNPEGYPAG